MFFQNEWRYVCLFDVLYNAALERKLFNRFHQTRNKHINKRDQVIEDVGSSKKWLGVRAVVKLQTGTMFFWIEIKSSIFHQSSYFLNISIYNGITLDGALGKKFGSTPIFKVCA